MLLPGAVSADAFDGDVGDIAGRGGVRGDSCSWSNVGLGKLVEQLGCASLGDPGTARDDEVVIQTVRYPPAY